MGIAICKRKKIFCFKVNSDDTASDADKQKKYNKQNKIKSD